MQKIINSNTAKYQPMLTDNLVLDDKPTVNSFNGITSDAVARAIAGASGEVPAVTEADNGKILTAIYDAGGAAVEWADAPSGIPDMTGQDGKILGAVDNGGTMEAQWISKPVSNVTTSDKQFVVGVNGSGKPITVDCANATTVGTTSTFTENGTYTLFATHPSVVFPLAHLDPCSLGSGTATLTVPEDITYDTMNMSLSSVTVGYWNGSGVGSNCSITSGLLSTGKINAGTYTISGANAYTSYFSDGIILFIMGSGNPTTWDNFLATFTEAIQSWTLSYTASEVTGYSITPAVLPTVTGNAGKVLKVNAGATAVEWASLPSSSASFNTTFDLISRGTNVWPAYVQQSSSPAPTIDLPEGVYAYRVEGNFIASAAVDDVYNIEVGVGNGNGQRDFKAIGLQSDSDNGVSIRTSGILNIPYSASGISKAQIYVAVNPAKSSTSSVVSAAMYDSVQLKLAKL